MAFEKPVLIQSFTAASAMSNASFQFSLVRQVAGDMLCVPCSATTDYPLGVLQNLPGQGQQAEVLMLGISKVRVGATDIAAVTASYLACDATGRAMVVAYGTNTAAFVIGRVLQIDNVDNDGAIVTALINTLGSPRAY